VLDIGCAKKRKDDMPEKHGPKKREKEKGRCVMLHTKPPRISSHLSLALDPRDEHLDS